MMANLAGVMLGFGMFANFLGISYLVQLPHALTGYGFDASILRASVEFLLPGAIASADRSTDRWVLIRVRGPRFVLGLTAICGAVPFAWLAYDHTHTASVIGAGIVIGAAVSLGYAAMPAIIMSSVPRHQSGIANGINSISRSTGSAMGSAVVTTILASMTIANLPRGRIRSTQRIRLHRHLRDRRRGLRPRRFGRVPGSGPGTFPSLRAATSRCVRSEVPQRVKRTVACADGR